MQKYISSSDIETKQIAAKLAKEDRRRIFALSGDLGAGKTTFAQGFAKGLRIKDKIISPTFVLIRQHPVPETPKVLYHIDLYRLENVKELGLENIFADQDSIVLIEWAEKLKKLPDNAVRISIEKISGNKRSIIVE